MNNSMIAKLLAKENITVEHGNFRTAFFDVEKRVLGLPLWKDMGKDVYDLLVGHEVGHALFTPAAGWHESTTEIPGCPRAYINIVEDIRIEKLIQRQYPGLVGAFKRGYSVLNDDDFFGLSGKDLDTLHLADRLNVKSKLRDLIDINYSAKEMTIVDQCFAVETWEDVLEACRALYNFIEENKDDKQEESIEAPMADDSGNDDVLGDDAAEQTDGEDGDEKQDANPNGSGSPSDSEESEPSGKADLPDETDGDSIEEPVGSDGAGNTNEGIDPHQSVTDSAFRNNEDKLLDQDDRGYQRRVVKAITRKQAREMINPYELVAEKRDAHNLISEPRVFNEELKKFNEDSKKFVALMSKEFEMRKMAYRTKRAQSSRSGSLDMTRLHAYKYTDDIFNKVTRLADAKSHGMVMFIDFSGSMHPVIGDTIRQTLILTSFCKKVNIPFEVYSFTTGGPLQSRERNASPVALFDHSNTNINTLLTSNMSKSTYEKAYNELFAISSRSTYVHTWDSLGGTPLNETIMASRFILSDFKARTKVQKVNVVFLTDGDAQSMYVDQPYETDMDTSGTTVIMDGKRFDLNRFSGYRDLTATLLDELRKEYTVIGYFLAERPYDVRGKVWQSRDAFVSDEEMKEILKEYRNNKFVSFSNVLGYDEFFIIRAERGSLNTEEDEFEVSENAKKGEIQRAFKKHANSKKANKLFATQFAKMVA